MYNGCRYERDPEAAPPFPAPPAGPGAAWRALVAGLLRVPPARRLAHLDTLRHPALAPQPLHSLRDQVTRADARWRAAPRHIVLNHFFFGIP